MASSAAYLGYVLDLLPAMSALPVNSLCVRRPLRATAGWERGVGGVCTLAVHARRDAWVPFEH